VLRRNQGEGRLRKTLWGKGGGNSPVMGKGRKKKLSGERRAKGEGKTAFEAIQWRKRKAGRFFDRRSKIESKTLEEAKRSGDLSFRKDVRRKSIEKVRRKSREAFFEKIEKSSKQSLHLHIKKKIMDHPGKSPVGGGDVFYADQTEKKRIRGEKRLHNIWGVPTGFVKASKTMRLVFLHSSEKRDSSWVGASIFLSEGSHIEESILRGKRPRQPAFSKTQGDEKRKKGKIKGVASHREKNDRAAGSSFEKGRESSHVSAWKY